MTLLSEVDSCLLRLAASPSQTSKLNTRDNSMVQDARCNTGEGTAVIEEARLLNELDELSLEQLKVQVRSHISMHVQPERAILLS